MPLFEVIEAVDISDFRVLLRTKEIVQRRFLKRWTSLISECKVTAKFWTGKGKN